MWSNIVAFSSRLLNISHMRLNPFQRGNGWRDFKTVLLILYSFATGGWGSLFSILTSLKMVRSVYQNDCIFSYYLPVDYRAWFHELNQNLRYCLVSSFNREIPDWEFPVTSIGRIWSPANSVKLALFILQLVNQLLCHRQILSRKSVDEILS